MIEDNFKPIVTQGIQFEYVPSDVFDLTVDATKYGFVNVDEEGNLIFKDANNLVGVRVRDMMNFIDRIKIIDGVLHFFDKSGNTSVTLSELVKEKKAIALSNSLWWNKKRMSNKISTQITGTHIRNTEIFLKSSDKRSKMIKETFASFIKRYQAEWDKEWALANVAPTGITENVFLNERRDRLNERRVENQWFDLPIDCAVVTPLVPADFAVSISAEIVFNIAPLARVDDTGYDEYLTQMQNVVPHIENKINFRLVDTVVTTKNEIKSRNYEPGIGPSVDVHGDIKNIDVFDVPTTLDVTTTARLVTDKTSPYYGKIIVNLSYIGPVPAHIIKGGEKISNVVSDPNLEGIQERKITDLFKNLGIKTDEEACFENCLPKNYTTVYALAPEFRNKKDEFFSKIDTPHIFRVQWQSQRGAKNLFTYYKEQDPRRFEPTPLYKEDQLVLPQHLDTAPVDMTTVEGNTPLILTSDIMASTDTDTDVVAWHVVANGGEYENLQFHTTLHIKRNEQGQYNIFPSVEPLPIDTSIANAINMEFSLTINNNILYLQARTSTPRVTLKVTRNELNFDVVEGLNVCESTMEVSIFNMNGHPLDVMQQGMETFNGEITRRVKFTNQFEDANYSVSFTKSGNVKVWWSNKEKDGFTINCNREFEGTIDWVASKHPKKIPSPSSYQFSADTLGSEPDNFITANTDYNVSNRDIVQSRIEQNEENLLDVLKRKRTHIES